jgi:hypothetical protein
MIGFFRTIFYALLLLILGSACNQKKIYLFSYFIGNGEDGLHLAYSIDGYRWENINDGESLLTPLVGENKLMRDPCITQGPDGTFHMVWTTSWTGKTIGYASSSDLIQWSEQVAIPVMAQGDSVKNCWAPEINYNKEDDSFIIYWSSTVSGKFPETANSTKGGQNHRVYFTTTRDFVKFTETELFYDPGFNVIDASINEDDGRFVMFIKNETELPKAEKNISVVFADKITGPYGIPEMSITGDYWAEGPTSIKIDGTWFVYFDKYRKHEFGLVTSTDLVSWREESEKLDMPVGIRHGTVLKITPKVLSNLLKLGH